MFTIRKISTIIATSLVLGAFSANSAVHYFSNPSSLLLSIGSGSFASAAEPEYIPPSGLSRPQRTEGGGARGCTNSIPVSLSLLTPKDHIAQTVSAHPTFLWHISDATSTPMVFTLVERNVSQPIFQKQLKADKSGIVRLEVPQDAPALVEGKEYRWTVTLICSHKRPSENIYARAWIERVAIAPNLAQKLAVADSERDRALIYAQSGIWYDALSMLNKVHEVNPKDSQAFGSFISLLEQVGLTKVANTIRNS